ncbi:hypothetical protein A2954_04990 [Candidatus Roizmanbacteria bacterium RIFCSPLOWO2_01_FULL_37_12]|uniref:Urease accessory protein UreH-like transmembrane domain-containing protein n=1 Tax=Candidatus Roizmanbacteria bacterium RIFCSPLOWO2_01_FULL_37_12 TaxID=1802056 RepID=A0A1F7I8Q8_9BACT|nr:MAG: hypothetical protein A2768_02085 [Candidatus Roizmanbacteria bacterium RIFCSPHIGHO2_01_FULL_37_16]OGK23713.1 MAG: hypothetical protein A3D76_04035 [Candidatus Roizmanbacteria bacterium RIFCSPHIGHO2_02_FULL_37_9b]OGK39751.1 MAG: hypothetical protein A2954_04990 [Candidatus Roizmanbacteria bacterium RIFCSPLOWO2_01_FULL_37_12]
MPINFWTIFLTGLLTGGLTCLAVQGGLLAATIAQQQEERLKEKTNKSGNAFPILAFLFAKLISYTGLGVVLGWFGSLFQLSLSLQITMQFAVVVFMLGTAMNILKVHPIFRYFVIHPPKFLTRLVRKQSKSKDFFAPMLLGAFTVFIPCGTTQAMMALAIGSGNPVLGALIMFVFVLGTSPLFFTLGFLATRLGDSLHNKFMKLAAYVLIFLAIFNLNGAVALTGSNFTLENVGNDIWCFLTSCKSIAAENAVSEAVIEFNQGYYNPNIITVKANSAVKLNLVNKDGSSCMQSFVIPSLGILRLIQYGASDIVEFTAPKKTGKLTFMCGMGMYRGVINVI